jgi:hypothetical protein
MASYKVIAHLRIIYSVITDKSEVVPPQKHPKAKVEKISYAVLLSLLLKA